MRRLAWTAFGYAAAIFLAHYLLPAGALLWLALSMLAVAALSRLLPRDHRRRAALLAVGAAVGFGWYAGAVRLCLAPLRDLSDDVRTVSARVTAYPTEYDYSTGLTVRITEPGLSRMTARLYDYSGESAALRPGDEITVAVKLRPATERYGEATDSYLSRGIGLLGTVESAPEKTGVWRWRALYAPKTLARRLCETAARVFPADVSAFAQALMLGEKQALYDADLDIPLRNAGIMHAVAVSGMHLAYLLGFVRLVGGRRRRMALAALPLMAAFAIMAGCTPSVLRAAFMAALLLFAPILGRENDPATSLLAALAVLLAVNPFSAGSVSLQLSFGSMAGIFVLSGPIYRALSERPAAGKRPPRRAPHALQNYLAAATATSVGAMALTVPLSALHFGTVSLAAPVTNLLVLWALPVAFLGSYAATLAGLLWPLAGRALAWLVAWPLRYILLAARLIARVPGLLLSARNPLVVLWLIFVYVLLAATWRLSPRGKYRPVLPVCCCVCALCAVVLLTQYRSARTPHMTAVDVGQGQCLVFCAGRETVMVDCGGNHAAANAGDLAAQALCAEGRGALDVLVLTHPHQDHVNGVQRLLRQVRVRTLVLPAAAGADTDPVRGILALAAEEGVKVLRLEEDTALSLERLRLACYVTLGRTHENGCLMLRVSCGDFDTLVTGDVTTTVEAQLAVMYDLGGTELFIAGHHGSARASGDTLLDALDARCAIVSCGYNGYGHPPEEALARLRAHGLMICRTDEIGNVTVRME